LEERFQGIKEQQKRFFNNQFLAYKGKDVKKEIIYNLLELAGRNMEKYETIGEDSFKIFISEGMQNINSTEVIKRKIEQSGKKYSIDFEYDLDGKVNMIKIYEYEDNNT
jgi:hypothetical protein